MQYLLVGLTQSLILDRVPIVRRTLLSCCKKMTTNKSNEMLCSDV